LAVILREVIPMSGGTAVTHGKNVKPGLNLGLPRRPGMKARIENYKKGLHLICKN